MPGLRRRTLLRTLAGASAVALAGCNDATEPTTTRTTSEPPAVTPTVTPTLTPTPSPTASPSPTATPTPEPSADRTARMFIEALAAAAYERAAGMLSDQAAAHFSTATLQQYWLGLTAQHGEFAGVGPVETTTEGDRTTVTATVECRQDTQDVRLTVEESARIVGLSFPASYSPPDYADTAAFTEREVTLGDGDCSLGGTLSVPTGASDDPVPGVVLVHGSGANDRDSTIFANKPLKDIAWGLASRGIAVYRYDKRTYQCRVPPENWGIGTIVVDDALDALDVLRSQSEVDAGATFVVGHSLGATCTPRIASRDDRLAGGAMLAANARPMPEVVADQVRHLLSVDGDLTDDEQSRLDTVQRELDRVAAGQVDPGETVLGLPGSWWRSLREYDQVATADAVSTPLLLAQGGRDYQVPPDTEFDRWQRALAERDATRLELYPNLSHLFQPGSEPSLGYEYRFPDNVAEGAVTDLAGWVDEQAG